MLTYPSPANPRHTISILDLYQNPYMGGDMYGKESGTVEREDLRGTMPSHLLCVASVKNSLAFSGTKPGSGVKVTIFWETRHGQDKSAYTPGTSLGPITTKKPSFMLCLRQEPYGPRVSTTRQA